MKFMKHLQALLTLVDEGRIINPFKETSSELVTLDTGKFMDPAIARCLRDAPNTGKAMYRKFVQDRINTTSKPLSDVIP